MASSNVEIAGWTPPPPLPRRVLNYEPPQHLASPQVPLPQLYANMNPYAGNLPAASPRAGLGAGLVPSSAADYYSYTLPTTPTASGQKYQQVPTSAGPVTERPYTLCFYDHLGHLTLMVFVPELRLSMSTTSSPSSTPQHGPSAHPTTRKPLTPKSEGHTVHDANGKCETIQITVQVYFHSTSSPFKHKNGVKTVDQWCRQLQLSTAFHHLRKQLSERGKASTNSPIIRIEAYDALAEYKDIINHSLNEREFRGLQGCYEYIERFLQYVKRRSAEPNFVLPEHVAAKGRAFLESRKFIKGQMEDIRNGDGGKHRRRRAALREQLQPAFDDGRGPEGNVQSDFFGSNRSSTRPQPSVDKSIPASSTNISPSRILDSVSPQQISLSPGPVRQDTAAQGVHRNYSRPLNLRRNYGHPTQQNQRRLSPGTFNAPHQASQPHQPRSGSQAPSASAILMPPPPTPSQGYQRPVPQPPREGSLDQPFRFAPFPLSVKSVYRGVSQPYHHFALVIDSPDWATTSGIGVLKFGYEPDWANGENIQRAGACFERVSMAKGTGKRWLGDALVECFVGESDQEVPEWLKDLQSAVDWPGGDGGTDDDFGIAVGVGNEKMDEFTSRMLKKVSVIGAEYVDFMGQEWVGLV